MLHGVFKDAGKERILEAEAVNAEVIVDVLGDVEADGLTVLRLHIVEYDGFAMTDNQFGKHTLHL